MKKWRAIFASAGTKPSDSADKPSYLFGKDDYQGEAHLTVPSGIRYIENCAVKGVKTLESAVISGTVSEIGAAAFADCINLTRIELCEGVRKINSNAFAGCSKLRSVILPKSLRYADDSAFRACSLTEAVYNKDRTVLFYYPLNETHVIAVDDGVKIIRAGAFRAFEGLPDVTLTLPESLEMIEQGAVSKLSVRKLTIPKNVKYIRTRAICGCEQLETVELEGAKTELSYGSISDCPKLERLISPNALSPVMLCRILGKHVLVRQATDVPEQHVSSEAFRRLAALCGSGDASAMIEMAEYFSVLHRTENLLFYAHASVFWRYFACQKGESSAVKRFDDLLAADSECVLGAVSDVPVSGCFMGHTLYALGFLFFADKTEREFWISPPDEFGICELRSYSGEEGPDEDGFGGEICYDYWFLDEYLNEIPGAVCMKNYTAAERRNDPLKFDAVHDQATANKNRH